MYLFRWNSQKHSLYFTASSFVYFAEFAYLCMSAPIVAVFLFISCHSSVFSFTLFFIYIYIHIYIPTFFQNPSQNVCIVWPRSSTASTVIVSANLVCIVFSFFPNRKDTSELTGSSQTGEMRLFVPVFIHLSRFQISENTGNVLGSTEIRNRSL